MNMNKEDAKIEFVKMIKNSWTYARLTEKERACVVRTLFDARGVVGTAKQRWESLHDIYTAFLNALDYSPTGWRETDEEKANKPLF